MRLGYLAPCRRLGALNSHCLGLAVLAAVCLLAGPAAAEESPIDYTEFTLSDLMDMDVVIGASKYEQKAADAPSAVTILTAAEIEAFGYTTLAEILGSLRGFYTTYDRTYQYLGARGFGRPGDYNSRVLVLVDGVRVNENVYDAAAIGSTFLLDVGLIDRVEVIRGPSSSIYGTSAVFGIVNVLTKHGHQIDGVQAQAEFGSFGSRQGHLTVGSGETPGLEWLVSGTLGRTDGQDFYYSEFDDPATNDGWFRNGDRDDWQRVFGNASFRNVHLASAFSWREKLIPTASWATVFNDNRTRTEDNQGFVAAWYEGSLAPATKLLARMSYHTYTYAGDWVYDYAEEGDDPYLVLFKDDAKGTWLNAEAQVTRSFAGGHTLSGGVEQRKNYHQDQATWDEDPYWLYLNDDHESSNWGAYLQGEYRFGPGLLVNAGVRHDYYPTFGENTNPRLALVARPRQGSVMKLLYGSAFRSPNLYELYYHDEGTTSKPNPDLGPETIDTYELVWDQELGENLHGLVSVYRYQISDLIDQVEDPQDQLLVFRNTGQIEARGFEAELTGRHPSGVRHRMSYSLQTAEYAHEGGRLTNSPQHLFKLNLVVPVHRLDTTAGLEMQYASKRLTNLGRETEGYLLTNLTLTKEIPAAGLRLFAGVHNLFDQEYGHPGGVELLQDILWQDGRSFRMAVTIQR